MSQTPICTDTPRTALADYDRSDVDLPDVRIVNVRCRLLGEKVVVYSIQIFPEFQGNGYVRAAIDMLKDLGVPSIHLLTICASEGGVKSILQRHPEVEIHAAALDPDLNEQGYIMPGLGDAGDRLYHTQ